MAGHEQKTTRTRRRRPHPWAFPLGLAVIALAIIGAITLISAGVNGVRNLTDDSELRQLYEKRIEPVVMNDMDPFDDIAKADMAQLLDAAIWSLLKDNINPDEYEWYDGEVSGILVPREDVEIQFGKLFGKDLTPVHQTVRFSALDFVYDEPTGNYIVPLTGVEPVFIPKVYTIEKKADSVILTVGYISGIVWDLDKDSGEFRALYEPEPDKFMRITLRGEGDAMIISSIRATDAMEIAVSTQPRRETMAPTETVPATTVPVTQEDTSEDESAVLTENPETEEAS